jgi:hypothetical protein
MKIGHMLAVLAAGAWLLAVAAVGCSSNDPGGDPPTTAGQTGSSGANGSSGASSGQTASSGMGQTGSSGGTGSSGAATATPDASAGQEGGPDATGGCSTYPGVTVANVDAGAQSPTWGCVETNCGAQLAACAADCKCNDLILKAFFASHDEASANAAFKAALDNGGPPADAILVGVCLQTFQSSCPMWGSGSADAAAGD